MVRASTERLSGTGDLGRVYTSAVGESDQESLVPKHMLEHACEKAGRARGVADRAELDAGDGKEAVEPFRLLRDEGKRLNRKEFRRFPCCRAWLFHERPFAFP